MSIKIINKKPFDCTCKSYLQLCTLKKIDTSKNSLEFYNYTGTTYNEKTHKIEVSRCVTTSLSMNQTSFILVQEPSPKEIKDEEHVRKMLMETNALDKILVFYYGSLKEQTITIKILDWTIYDSDVIIVLNKKNSYNRNVILIIPIECLYSYSK